MSGILGIGGGGDTEFYPYALDQSVRFNDNDSAYLSRTPASAGDQTTYTLSMWFKYGNIKDMMLFGAGSSTSNQTYIRLYGSSNQAILWETDTSATTDWYVRTDAVLRDPSAWYHLVFVFDNSLTGITNKAKIYINGELASIAASSGDYPSGYINAAVPHYIGRSASTTYTDGYISEVNFIDGTALDASYFGETKAGIWIPKQYTGSYGTNGFKLAFQDSASLGDDTSGNGNDFTSSGLASTDQMLDTPTSNFPTMNTLWQSKGTWTTAEGNLENTWAANNYQSGIATMGLPATGKWYWEIYLKSRTYTNWLYWNLVIADYVEGNGNNGNSPAQWSNHHFTISAERSDASYLVVSSGSTNSIASSGIYDTGDVIQVAFDADNKRLYLGDSGTWFLSADPGAESGDSTAVWYGWSDDAQGKLFPALNVNYLTYVDVFNFGQDSTFAGNLASGGNADANGIGDFKYSVPTGYLALCAANLPAPGINPNAGQTPTDYFNTVTYTGVGGQSITGVGFQPDFVWIKSRSASRDHKANDVVRGVNKEIVPNEPFAESTRTTGLTSFDSDGFTVGSESGYDNSGDTFVAWNWKAGGTAVSNTDGDITSSVSVSPDSGFSIVTYTGNGTAGQTVGHGLGKAPSMVIVKKRNDDGDARGWAVYHEAITASKGLRLDDNFAEFSAAGYWNSTAPTASVFTLGSGQETNYISDTYVAYCFADIDGMVKAGTYTGNGLTDGSFVYTGFRPAWVLMKPSSTTGDWELIDSVRSSVNLPTTTGQNKLEPNNNGPESLRANAFYSNGFRVSGSGNTNASGVTYIYLAFAEQPFKYANAR